MLQWFKRNPKPTKDPNKIIGVHLGWDLKPHIFHEDGTYYPTDIERMVYPDYFIEGQDWAVDPITKEKLPIAII